MRAARLACALLAGALASVVPAPADAQHATAGTIRVLLPFADDVTYAVGRLISESIGRETGRAVVIEPRPGATGRVAAEAFRNSAPDGSTLFLAPIAVPVMTPLVFTNLRYDPVKDFAPITQVALFRYGLAVGPEHPARDMREFVAWAKASRAQVTFGSPGAGTVPHFLGLMIGREAGMALVHVPYKSGAPMAVDLMGGQIAAGVDGLANLLELHRAGRIRILATSGTARSPFSPAVPTFKEQGLAVIDPVGWIALYARTGTPKPLIDRLSAAIVATLRTTEARERILALGLEPTGTTPEDLAAIMAADTARWAPIVRASGFVAE